MGECSSMILLLLMKENAANLSIVNQNMHFMFFFFLRNEDEFTQNHLHSLTTVKSDPFWQDN